MPVDRCHRIIKPRPSARLLTISAALAAVMGGPAFAEVVADSASGTAVEAGVTATVTLLPLVTNTSASVTAGTTQGTAPAPFNLGPNAAAAVNLTSTLTGVSTGVLSSAASSTVNAGIGPRTSTGSSSVANASVGVLPGVINIPLLGLGDVLDVGASVLSSTSSVTGDQGTLVASGSAQVVGLVVTVAGTQLALSVPSTLTPNYTIAVDVGSTLLADIVLDEQTETTVGNTTSITTDALDVEFTGNLLAGLGALDLGSATLSGGVVFGQSTASETTQPGSAEVPEPPQGLILGSFLIGLLGVRWWTRPGAARSGVRRPAAIAAFDLPA